MKKMNLAPSAITEVVNELGEKKFRAKQLIEWIYEKHVYLFEDMTNLPKSFRSKLAENYFINVPEIVQTQSADDGTTKFLLKLEDGALIEMVLMPKRKEDRFTLCVSSQVGCSRRCEFCATGKMGLKRNLSTDEIFGQVLLARQFLKDKMLTNIVFMGMGEPLDNFDNVMRAITFLQNKEGTAMSSRKMTISTCGITPNIYKLVDSGVRIKLAVSLNTAIQHKRVQLMPVGKKFQIALLRQALLHYGTRSFHPITLEYIMIKDFNMDIPSIKALEDFTKDMNCKLNLIPWNPVEGMDFVGPTDPEIDAFLAKLDHLPIPKTVRRSKGTQIDAACGQLSLKNYEIQRDKGAEL